MHRQRVLVFAVSAMFCGIAGSLQVINNESVSAITFELRLSAEVVLNAFIGGVAVFLGPALGAAVMTFFGFALSDLTRSWLLYQGILFVMVMLVFPSGLAGLLQAVAGLRHRGRAGLQLFAMSLAAALLLTAATVFTIELVQRLASADYQQARSAGAAWPPVQWLGRGWPPGSPWTWLPPLLAGIVGVRLAKSAGARWRRIGEAPGAEPVAPDAVAVAAVAETPIAALPVAPRP